MSFRNTDIHLLQEDLLTKEDLYQQEERSPEEIQEDISKRALELISMMRKGKAVEALSKALVNPPYGKNINDIKKQHMNTIFELLSSIKPNEIRNTTQTLNIEQQDVLMKYLYKGLSDPKTYNPAILLTWHEKKFLPRRGDSSLFASISWLSKETDWQTKLVAWTGEITTEFPQETFTTSNNTNTSNNANTISLTSKDKEIFLECFSKIYKEDVTPIWMLPDSDNTRSGETVEQQSRWRNYPNTVLWPLFHYRLWNNTTDEWNEPNCWKNYVEFNEAYLDAILKIYKPGDIIIIHDYYLLLLPRLLRQKIPDAYVGFFLHGPFPSSEIFRCLPKRKEILMGMLGANMIGFQSYSFSRHFISTCTRVLGFDSIGKGIDVNGAYVAIEVLPMGIDAKHVEKESQTQKTEEKMQFIKELYSNKKILIGSAKIYEVQGVLQGLKAFESFLKQFSRWRNQVVFIQVTSPVNDDTSKFEKQVQDLVSEINGTYGSLEFTPIHHYHQHLEKDEYFALLRSGDVDEAK
ncbi:hypothetical protein PCK2_000597 [Pneumocystis canis]|nr:hypothetical protein PCK2_000597 [Pneumocystis canis]